MPVTAPLPAAPPLRLLPLSQALDTLEALELESGPERRRVSGLLLGALLAALAGLPWLEVDEVARAAGWVRACTEHQDLRSPVAGRVVSAPAENGGWIEAGAVVLALEDGALEQRLREIGDRIERAGEEASEWARLVRLEAATGGDGPGAGEPATEWGRRLFAERRAADDVLGLAEEKARRDLGRVEGLIAQGLVSVREHDDLRHETALRAAARRGARERAIAEWRERQRAAESDLAAERARLAEATEAKRRLTVRAPLAGHLVGFRSRAPGSWVAAGEHLGTLSPGDGLRVEARVPARVAARVTAGQRARLGLEGLPPTDWGRLSGTVESVSADVADDRVGGYRVVIVPEADGLSSGGGTFAPVTKGNRADVHLVLGRTTLGRLLLRGVSGWSERAVAGPPGSGVPFPFPPNLPTAATAGTGVRPEGEPKP